MDVLLKSELKTIIRGKKSLLSIIIYLGVICAIISAMFVFQGLNSLEFSFYSKIIENFYSSVIITQYALICILIPFISYFSIKNDFLSDKLEIIKYTKISIFKYIFVKVSAVNIYFSLLYLTFIPLGIIMIFFGGATINSFIYYSAFSIATSFLVSSLTILFTVINEGKLLSVFVSYLIILFFSLFGFISIYLNAGFVGIIKKVYKYISPTYALNLYLNNDLLNDIFGDININILLINNNKFYIIEYLIISLILITISSIFYKRKCDK